MKNSILALAGLSLLLATNASAKSDIYIGAGLGQSFLAGSKVSEINQWSIEYGKSGTALTGRINAGLRFDNAFGVEAGYAAFGDVKSNNDSTKFKVSEKIVDLLGTYTMTAYDPKLFMDLGFGLARKVTAYKVNVADYNPSKDKNLLLTAMLGARYAVAENIDVNGQYRYWSRRIEGSNSHAKDYVQAVLVGAAYNF
jgi:opacity protein-like surface antigen